MKLKKSILMIAFLLMLSLASTCYGLGTTATLYAHGEGVAVGANAYFALKTSACDGAEGNITVESAASGLVALGNSSAIAISSLHSQVASLDAATWTFSYYAKANVTEKATLLCDIFLVTSADGAKATLGNDVAETALLTAANTTKTGTASIAKTSVATTDYIKIAWYANKTGTEKLKIDLWLDVAATPTKITGVSYTYATSAFWNASVRTMWKILLPILFVVSLGVEFVAYKKEKISMDTIIVSAIAFLLVAILVPIGIDLIVAA